MLILALLAMCGGAFAQGTTEKKKREKNPNDGSFWLDLKAGIGVTTSFDKSTVPFAYNGLLTHVQPGFTYEWKRCHIRFGAGLDRTRYSSLGGNAYNISGNFEFLYSCLKPSANRWHFWSGASLNGNFDLNNSRHYRTPLPISPYSGTLPPKNWCSATSPTRRETLRIRG